MNFVYLIKWKDCLNNVIKENRTSIVNNSDNGMLITTDDDTDLINKAVDNGCTAYARYYRFRLIKTGNLNEVLKIIRPLDLWIENNVLNMVINPLKLSTLDLARILYRLNFELELISEDDVEYTK
ncbi:hypothetical protein VMUT_0284 [Vulcanisaeta moutnovskia 768-28]|uniref:Uncharacterized protein n=1 Tax=Vulcanisaeta moutnovskia (strain 768-28) TaxID=985053 RepID=F0QTF6_VULM7|nr:hypothetical protein [Vulcanisaeta moutnovskia]ADY00498.1 hypothetical protein VMUT_0284 [Vulcanisaeta moutnovskia 768-28]